MHAFLEQLLEKGIQRSKVCNHLFTKAPLGYPSPEPEESLQMLIPNQALEFNQNAWT